jgi:hypothetical protein
MDDHRGGGIFGLPTSRAAPLILFSLADDPARQTVAQWRVCPIVAAANSWKCARLFKCLGKAGASIFNLRPVRQSLIPLALIPLGLWKKLFSSAKLNSIRARV